jgi:hypothetical protein
MTQQLESQSEGHLLNRTKIRERSKALESEPPDVGHEKDKPDQR